MGRILWRRWRDDERGQALIELALILPVFLLIVFGLIDAGRLVYTNSTVSQAAREGARLAAAEARWIGSSHPACVSSQAGITSLRPGAHVCPTDVTAFKAHIADAVERMTVAVGPMTAIHISCNDGSGADPAPSGAWTESVGGNGCADVDGDPISGSGDLVSVRLEYDYEIFTPLINTIIPSASLTGAATMAIN